jgi:hypothetical protein
VPVLGQLSGVWLLRKGEDGCNGVWPTEVESWHEYGDAGWDAERDSGASVMVFGQCPDHGDASVQPVMLSFRCAMKLMPVGRFGPRTLPTWEMFRWRGSQSKRLVSSILRSYVLTSFLPFFPWIHLLHSQIV